MSEIPVAALADRIRDVLISSGRLSTEDYEKIMLVMESNGTTFGEAALSMGVITSEDLAEATEHASKLAIPVGSGIVESALRKQSAGRGLPIKYTKMVKPGNSLIMVNQPEASFAEQIRALRAELQLRVGAVVGGSVLSVLSPCPGEGRTQLSAELAIAFAQTGCRTLLIDGDLRRPGLHRLFNADNSYGLFQCLSTGTASQFLGVENHPSLSLLMSGPTTGNPSGLLSSGALERLTRDWRKKYQMIIVDTPSISEYADGLTIAATADQILMVSRANITPHKSMKEALRRLAGNQARIVGAVINKF